jgi:hypothetical protein
MISLYAKLACTNSDAAKMLYRLVSERVRSRLSPEDAAVIAAWFDRLAKGEDARTVFPRTSRRRGRPRGSRSYPVGPTRVERPRVDDIDIAWMVRQRLETGNPKPGQVYAEIAKALRMKARNVANIYARVKKAGW